MLNQSMILKIVFERDSGKMKLEDNGKEIIANIFPIDRDLLKTILEKMDELLRIANIDPLSLDDVMFESIDCGFTAERISESVVNAYRFLLEEKKKRHV